MSETTPNNNTNNNTNNNNNNNTNNKNIDTFSQKASNDIVKPILPVTEDLQNSTKEMFTKVSSYIKSELATTVSDYNLLIQMNNITSSKYQDMTNVTKGLSVFMGDLKIKYEEFQPYFDKINELDKNVTDLEKTVQLLDEYTKRLEQKVKNIDKSSLLPTKQIQPPQPTPQQQQPQQIPTQPTQPTQPTPQQQQPTPQQQQPTQPSQVSTETKTQENIENK
ncbi:hypothetical protein ACTFIY_005304 [Dictyostelium cf. discoideum]